MENFSRSHREGALAPSKILMNRFGGCAGVTFARSFSNDINETNK